MITAASTVLFLPQSDASTPAGASPADPSINFLSLLFAFFPSGAMLSQIMPVQASAAASDLSTSAPLSEADVLSSPDRNTEKRMEDASTTLNGALSSEQGFLLSFLAPLLQGRGQPVMDVEEIPQLAATQDAQKSPQISPQMNSQATLLLPPPVAQREKQTLRDVAAQPVSPLAMQSLEQNQLDDLSLASADAVALIIKEELSALAHEGEKGDETFLGKPLSFISSPESDSAALLAMQDKDPRSAGPMALPGKATVVTSNIGTVERGVIIRRYVAFGGSTERQPTGSSLVLEPLDAKGQSSALVLETQNSDVANTAEMESASLFSDLESWKFSFSEAALKNHELADHARSTASQPEVDSLLRKAEEGLSAMKAEQIIASLSSRVKNRETGQDSVLSLSSTEVFTMNGPESNSAATLQSRPEGTSHISNLESWRQVIDQVGEGIIDNILLDKREARLQLAPPELGKLDIQLVVESGRIRAHIVAESADVGTLIQSHLPELKQALQTHRLDLDTVRVEVQTGGGDPNMFFQHSQQKENTRGRGGSSSFSSAAAETEPVRHTPASSGHGGQISVWA